MYALDYAARSDVGLVRASNQDSAYAGPNLLLVADGMGGHAGGDVASAIAVAAMHQLDDSEHAPATVLFDLENAMDEARLALVHASATNPRLSGLGTTAVALLRTENMLALAHMGDSRAYLLRDGELRQITVDHTFVQHLVDTGRIAPEDAAHHPNRNVVMRVLSDFDVDLHPDLFLLDVQVGDRWLLCSDGLSGFVELPELQALLAKPKSPAATAEALIEAAKHAASTDNITALVADIVALEDEPSGAAEVVGAAASDGPLREVVDRSIEEVRNDDWDDAVPMSTQELAAAGLTGSSAAPPTEPVLAISVSADTPTLGAADTAPIEVTAIRSQLPVRAAPPTAQQHLGTLLPSSPEPVADYAAPTSPAPGQQYVARISAPAIDQPVLFIDPEAAAVSLADDDQHARDLPRRHPVLLAVAVFGALALVGIGAWQGYAWTQRQFFVGQLAGRVAVFQGVPQNLGPITLHHAVDVLDTEVATLPQFFADRLDGTIRTDSRADARERADRLIADALAGQPTPASGPTPTLPGAHTTAPVLTPPPATNTPTPPAPQTGGAQGLLRDFRSSQRAGTDAL